MAKRIKPHHYVACGLENVYLRNGFKIRKTSYGRTVFIEKLEELHKAIARYLVREKKLLNGKEIRFVRHEMKYSQNRVAALLGVDEQTVARWEKGQCEISGPADNLIRLLYTEMTEGTTEIAARLVDLAETDSSLDYDFLFEEAGQGWRFARAA